MRSRFPISLFASLLVLAAPFTALAQAVETSGVKFDGEMSVGANRLVLNGAGTRYKFVIKVYAAALYGPAKVSTPEAVYDVRQPRAMKIVMLRDINASELGRLFTNGMQDNTAREDFAKAIPGTLKLADLFAARKKLVAGDNFVIDYRPGTGTRIVINGKPEGELIEEPEFYVALMKIWLGKAPADYRLKDALLGGKPN
ncbi:MAG TPA: chalcone isomerase family protein [Methylibium sp.]|uniref:chalcone isomerase family protein n=1 Tax=Methylibium sp. TaxID=2067992 RepID=UPI002DB5EA84|nr:chalcone isomerase family protein [Methylibium sp.]HEU4460116.1 chalcone isomerase family protein [Methylibium sp.]